MRSNAKKHILSVERRNPIPSPPNFVRMAQCERQKPFDDDFFFDFLDTLSHCDFIQYPDSTNLRRKIAEYHQVDPDNILITAGSDVAIRMVFDLFVKKSAITSEVYFPMYDVYAGLNNAVINTVKYTHSDHYDLEKFNNGDDLIVLANPNSPNGEYLSTYYLHKILNNRIPTLIDETYIDYVENPESLMNWINFHENLMISRSFSKGLGIAGARVGYIVSHKDNIAMLNQLRNMYEVTGASIKLAEHILDNIEQVKTYCEHVIQQRKILVDKMDEIGLEYKSSEGNWIHIEQNAFTDAFFAMHRMEVKSNCTLPNRDGKWLRVTLGHPLLNQFKFYLDTMKHGWL